jgi:hypothetical protein
MNLFGVVGKAGEPYRITIPGMANRASETLRVGHSEHASEAVRGVSDGAYCLRPQGRVEDAVVDQSDQLGKPFCRIADAP